MFELIAAVVAAIVSLVTKALGTQREQEAQITEGYLNDRGFEQTKTLTYTNLLAQKKQTEYIIIGVLIVGVFTVCAIILLRKKD